MASTILDSAIFRDIFTTAAMRAVWSDETRVSKYLEVEAALARAQGKLGIIPKAAAAEIARRCALSSINMAALKAGTEKAGSGIIPLVKQIRDACKGGHGEWAHWGATTQDFTDTGMVLQIRDALALVEKDIAAISDALAKLAKRYRDTPMAGRSKLQHAVPVTFGYRMATLLAAFERHRERLMQLRKRVEVGEFGGAAGTLASLGGNGLKVRDALMRELKLGAPDITWHSVRDTIGETGAFLALVSGTCAKIALDVTLLMQTEIDEVSEPAGDGRGGSSTMPQKKNPVSSVFVRAQAATVRQLSAALMESQAGEHERAAGPWEVEWIVLPDMFLLTAGALAQTREVVSGLAVHEGKMRDNLALTHGLIMAEAVSMALGARLGRHTAHEIVSRAAKSVSAKKPLLDVLAADAAVTKHFDRRALAKLLDPATYLGSAGVMVDRVLKSRKKR